MFFATCWANPELNWDSNSEKYERGLKQYKIGRNINFVTVAVSNALGMFLSGGRSGVYYFTPGSFPHAVGNALMNKGCDNMSTASIARKPDLKPIQIKAKLPIYITAVSLDLIGTIVIAANDDDKAKSIFTSVPLDDRGTSVGALISISGDILHYINWALAHREKRKLKEKGIFALTPRIYKINDVVHLGTNLTYSF